MNLHKLLYSIRPSQSVPKSKWCFITIFLDPSNLKRLLLGTTFIRVIMISNNGESKKHKEIFKLYLLDKLKPQALL